MRIYDFAHILENEVLKVVQLLTFEKNICTVVYICFI